MELGEEKDSYHSPCMTKGCIKYVTCDTTPPPPQPSHPLANIPILENCRVTKWILQR